MDDIEIRYILTIAREGSLSKAAEKLYISQPALSKFLRQHEKQIGAPLFHRFHGGLVPTETGAIWLSYAEQMEKLMNECQERIHQSLRKERKTVIIGIPASRVHMCTSLLLRLIQDNPEYEFQEVTDHSGVVRAMFEDGKYDLAVVNAESGGMLLVREEIGLAVPVQLEQKLNLQDHQPLRIHDLLDQEFVVSDSSNVIGKGAEDIFARESVRPSSLLIVDNTQLAWNMAKEAGRITFCICDLIPDGFCFHPFEPPMRNDLRLWVRKELEDHLVLNHLQVRS